MPEYLAPGVYIEETSFRAKSIEGVSTTTTGFVGPTRYGPDDLEPDIVTSLLEFERTYGSRDQLRFVDEGTAHNYMWHAVRAFFEEGGKRLYISRVYEAEDAENGKDGRARARLPSNAAKAAADPNDLAPPVERAYPKAIHVAARFPGAAGNLRVRFTLRLGQNILRIEKDPVLGTDVAKVGAVSENDIVLLMDRQEPYVSSPPGSLLAGTTPRRFASSLPVVSPPSPLSSVGLLIAKLDDTLQTPRWRFQTRHETSADDLFLNSADANHGLNHYPGLELRVVTLTVTVITPAGETTSWEGLPLDPMHQRGTSLDSFTDFFRKKPGSLTLARQLPIAITLGSDVKTGLDVFRAINGQSEIEAQATHSGNSTESALLDMSSSDLRRSVDAKLEGGTDGNWPGVDGFKGDEKSDYVKTGLKAFEDLEDISIVAAPGSTWSPAKNEDNSKRAQAISLALISHAERMRYRIAVLDSEEAQDTSEVRSLRAKLDSKYAALYYPWVKVLDPVTRKEIALPPSGFVSGIYARNDIERAVYKAPANEVVRGAIGFERTLNKAQQEVLNPEGVNCFRFFEGRGYRLWGARTISSDPEWKYVNLRRYFAYVERSIDKGTQWAVFEPNGDQLWANVRRTIEDFLLNEWQNGALLGDKPEKAFFVKCDRSTMSQNDLDNGRMVCLIGLVALRPAEFVIFRVGQWTADRKI